MTIHPWLCEIIEDDGDQHWCDGSQNVYWIKNATQAEQSGELINGGMFREFGHLTFLSVPKAGHYVPSNYYSVTEQFLADYIE